MTSHAPAQGHQQAIDPARFSWLPLLLFLRCQAAAIAPMMALMLVPISGAIALGIEMSGFYYVQRSAQNAADSAALAAAINKNDSGSGSTYINEARAAAKPFGFVNGAGDTVVNAEKLITCPTGTPSGLTCYKATVSTVFPVTFSRIIGFTGDTANGQTIVASSVATVSGTVPGGNTQGNICVWTLSTLMSEDLTWNGAPKANLDGCGVVSNTTMQCHGGDVNAGFALQVAGTSDSGCPKDPNNEIRPGDSQWVSAPSDATYRALRSNIPSPPTPCTPTNTNLNVTTLSGVNKYCGNVTLKKNINITAADTTIVVYNGILDLDNSDLTTSGSGSVTIILAGNSSFQAKKSKVDIKAPDATSTSPWKGVALYQDPNGTVTQSTTLNGSQVALNMTGLVYLPKTNLTFNGIVNKATNGAACWVLLANEITFNGVSLVADISGCATAGTTVPQVTIGSTIPWRERLVR